MTIMNAPLARNWLQWEFVVGRRSDATRADAERPDAVPAERRNDQLGTLTGRFVYDGQPPALPNLYPQFAKLEANQPQRSGADGRFSGVEGQYREYLAHGIRPPTTDESLLVSREGGIANVLIWVTSKDIPWTPPAAADWPVVAIRYRGGKCSPRVAAVAVGQPLVIENHDPVRCSLSVDFQRALNAPVSAVLEPASVQRPLRFTFRSPENYPAHYVNGWGPWMRGAVFVHRNTYVAVSQPDGTFALPRLPLGEWQFRVWHERSGYVSHWPQGLFKHTIKPSDNRLGTIKLQPALFGVNAAASSASHAPPPQNRQQVGEVLGKPVYRDEIQGDNLQDLFFGPVRKKYMDAHQAATTPTSDEIKYATEYFDKDHRARLEADGGEPKLRRQLEAIERRLAAGGLTDDEEQKLETEHSHLRAKVKSPAGLLAWWTLVNWKAQKHLYDEFGGGRVLIGKFGHEAFDANRVWRESLEQQGEFKITDPQLRAKFYEPWTRDRRGFVTGDKERVRRLLLEPEWVAPAASRAPNRGGS